MQVHYNVWQTPELTYMIVHIKTRLHLREFTN